MTATVARRPASPCTSTTAGRSGCRWWTGYWPTRSAGPAAGWPGASDRPADPIANDLDALPVGNGGEVVAVAQIDRHLHDAAEARLEVVDLAVGVGQRVADAGELGGLGVELRLRRGRLCLGRIQLLGDVGHFGLGRSQLDPGGGQVSPGRGELVMGADVVDAERADNNDGQDGNDG